MAQNPTPPSTTVPGTVDWVGTVYGSGFTPTTVVGQPKTTTTTTPKTTTTTPLIKTKTQDSDIPLSQKLDEQILYKQAKLYGTRYTPQQIETAQADLPWYKDLGLGALEYGILKPLQVLDVGRRVVQSSIKNQADVYSGKQNPFEAAKDFYREVTDPNLKSTELFNINTGHKWLDKTIGFTLDVGLDPTTYLTLGTGTAAKIGLQTVVKTAGKEAAERIVREAAEDLVAKGVKEVTEAATKKLIVELGEGATKKQVRQGAAAIVAEAAQVAKQAGVAGADKKLAQAARRWTAVAPRKQLGFGARTATATSIKELRDQAALEASELAGTAAGRRAEAFVRTMTDDVIEQIAVRGIGGLDDNVLKELGVAGGLRWGVGGAKVALGKPSNVLTRNVGNALSKTRLNLLGAKLPGGSTVAKLITGANIPEVVFDAKTGLRSGAFATTKESLDALEVIAKNNAYKGFKKVAAPTVKALLRNTLSKENAQYKNSVYELLAPGVDLTKTLDEIAIAVDRPVVQAEVDFAKKINTLKDELIATAKSRGITVVNDGTNFFPETLTQDAIKFLSRKDDTAKAVLAALGFNKPPLPGQNIGRQLVGDVLFFGQKTLNDDGTLKSIKELNKIARDFGGFKGDFFDTNVERALEKYTNKFIDDYALMAMVWDETTRGLYDTGTNWGVGYKPALIGGPTSEIAVSTPLRPALKSRLLRASGDEVKTALQPWVLKDLDATLAAIEAKARRIEGSALSNTARESANDALNEVREILFNLRQAVAAGDDIADAWANLLYKTQAEYATLFSNSPEKIAKFIDTLKPEQLRTMVKLAEDTFVALDSHVMPDTVVKAELANVFSNINRLKNINERNAFLKGLNTYNQSVKTWYTTSVGFHTRNIISNYFQMFAGGASPANISRGIGISNKWNEYLEETAPRLTKFEDLDSMIDDFFKVKNIGKADQAAARDALKYSGGAGFGDLEEIYSGNFGRMGITGREATGRIPFTGRQSEALRKASEVAGKLPEKSRSFGNKIEDQSRFIFTFDGVKSGLTAQESVARTAKFLVDYTDLSELDQVAKQFIPFWMWMSRNLPNQFVNMYANPGLYQKYNAARRNFENADGTSVLSPNYIVGALTPKFIQEAGGTILGQIPGVGAIYAKPDLGFPGAGSPSPLQQGVTDLDSLLSSLTPALRGPLEQIAGREFFSGSRLEGAPARVESAVETAIPQLSTLSRLLNIPAAGTDIPGLRNIPGIYESTTASGNVKDSSDNLRKLQALLSYLGIPIGVIGGNEQNIARYDIINRLKDMERNQ